jgi:hypothetical protein
MAIFLIWKNESYLKPSGTFYYVKCGYFSNFEKFPNFGKMNPRTYGLPITKFAYTLCLKPTLIIVFYYVKFGYFSNFENNPNFGEMNPRTYGLPITKFASTLCLKPTYV